MLEGTGREQTIIKGAEFEKPLIFIPQQASPEIRMADLALTGSLSKAIYATPCDPIFTVGRCAAGIEVGGAAKLSLHRVQLDNHSVAGIWVYNKLARVQLFDSQIGSAKLAGILLYYAELRVVNSEIFVGSNRGTGYYRVGIWATDSSSVTLVSSTIRQSDAAMRLERSAQVVVTDSRFWETGISYGDDYSPEYGEGYKALITGSEFLDASLLAAAKSQITILHSRFNRGGIILDVRARAVIQNSEIAENSWSPVIQSGIWLSGSVEVYLESNRIVRNRDWGVALDVPQCERQFGKATPRITGRDNEIPDKDQPNGNKKGALCPPDYPWPPGFRK
ncbi:MAG: right-handed parallel beta-helix repeat-containing protein [Candidatus Bipolaricaulota bacterium]|nr:right-handed parallel beta-helix repeat-containing protein [Candidatus Bipolaricaulota bacterium]